MTTMSYDVVFYKIRFRKKPGSKGEADGYPRPYQVRWKVAGKEHHDSFATSDLADGRLSDLRRAARKGQQFDVESGLPEEELRALEEAARNVSWFAHAVEYAHFRWPDMAGNTRASMVEALMAVTPVLVDDLPGAPDKETLRFALRNWAFDPNKERAQAPRSTQAALEWLEKASLPIKALTDAKFLGAAMRACATKLDGTSAASDYYSRRRRGFSGALTFAVTKKRLAENPLKDKELPQVWQPPKLEDEVDPRAIGNPQIVRHTLTMVSYVGRTQGPRFAAWFGCMYYAMMRPEEVAGLKRSGCKLPVDGWGKLTFATSTAAPGRQWTDSGEVHEERELKGRGRKSSRTVPIPPVLVRMLREHIAAFGTDPKGRLFHSRNGNRIQPSTYWQVWQRTRELAFAPEQREGPLLKRPYDLRHAGVTYRLNRGVPATQVAKWAGHSVETLQRVYAQVWAEMDEVWIDRMGEDW
ncbi:tyrosine-type recombinase/integrase [Nocardiopsis suaedae]|uniref:Tyrosine-type recombinase/integrase n=1 Tax=Nocardiopsis suaedae TaxID=3018444 RepID=A0ABT4TJC6_9ACTN|nr:tyrosine-type recombinase/integrase [Nocardiopsis suaedae]MDA2804471.1 tyrosine-type recombinase/integrase [Nocardiopsis suaedae]